MDKTTVIIKPLITEKTTHQQNVRNTYAFEVRKDANKNQIKDAVESLYNVKVTEVRTQVRKGKPRRSRFKITTTSDFNRAIVVLDEASKIELF
jgi:large subunit ribosomal protein L23